jgi:predicted RNA-binding Zn ribbon-like protein
MLEAMKMVKNETYIKRNLSNILKSLVAVMFVLSLFSGMAAADSPREKYQETKEKYQVSKDKYNNARDKFKDAEKNFKDARQKFSKSKDKASRDELKDRTGDYLERAIDQMISHLEVLKTRVESSENNVLPFDAAANIDTHIAALEEIRTKVQQAETPPVLVDSARELKEQWETIRLETRYASGILITNKIDTFMAKSDNVSERMDAVIQTLKDDGKDTAKLEKAAERFNKQIDEARENQQEVLDLYSNHDGFDADGMVTDTKAAQSFLKDAEHLQKDTNKKLKAASKEVSEFFKETKKHIGKSAVISGNGTLEASGNGRAVIRGDVTVTLSAVNGTMIVSNNSEVTTDGSGTREELGNGNVKYEGFGSATISGNSITVEISGNGIELTATGTGSAVLNGNGTYKTEGGFGTGGEWKQED